VSPRMLIAPRIRNDGQHLDVIGVRDAIACRRIFEFHFEARGGPDPTDGRHGAPHHHGSGRQILAAAVTGDQIRGWRKLFSVPS
jgi:hypothetical protein